MNRIVAIALVALWAASANAQVVHRCLNAEGERVFADRPCAHFGMSSAAKKPDAARQISAQGVFNVEAERGPAEASLGCPGANPEALRDSLLAAIASQDLNAMTGMYYWAGAGRRSANSVIDLMKDLITSAPQFGELRAPEVSDDWLWAGLPPPTEQPMPELLLMSDASASDPIARFSLHAQAGCVWLSQN